MLKITPAQLDAVNKNRAEQAIPEMILGLRQAEPVLTRRYNDDGMRQIVEASIAQARGNKLESRGAVYIYAKLRIACRGENPETRDGFRPLLDVLADRGMSEPDRLERANAILLNLDESLPPDKRTKAFAVTPELED